MKKYLVLLALSLIAFIGISCQKSKAPANPYELGPVQSDIMPQPDTFYTLLPNTLFKTNESGPAESTTSRAWSKANEFVFRTALRNTVALPSSSVKPNQTGYIATFKGKNGQPDIKVIVSPDFKAVKLLTE